MREIPTWDNPSGDYCADCRSLYESIGLFNVVRCSDPVHCGGMRPMARGPRFPRRPRGYCDEAAAVVSNADACGRCVSCVR
jgi:hypothetical protein